MRVIEGIEKFDTSIWETLLNSFMFRIELFDRVLTFRLFSVFQEKLRNFHKVFKNFYVGKGVRFRKEILLSVKPSNFVDKGPLFVLEK